MGHVQRTSAARRLLNIVLRVIGVLHWLKIVAWLLGATIFATHVNSDVRRAKTQMANLNTAIGLYLIANRRLPANLEELLEIDPPTDEAFIREIPLDPWTSPYQLRILDRADHDFEIVSFGRDRREGTKDDIVFPERRNE